MPVDLIKIYQALEHRYPRMSGWPGGRWPVGGQFKPERLEVVAGAILTQNTRWSNVERALQGLVEEGLVEATTIDSCSLSRLEGAIRPSGFYRQKAVRLKRAARLILDFPGEFYQQVGREELLSTEGIGPETADSILLYACEQPYFVVDAYTQRIFARYGLLGEGASYQATQDFFQTHLPLDVGLYQRFHALIVEHAKQACRKTPLCDGCALQDQCRYGLEEFKAL